MNEQFIVVYLKHDLEMFFYITENLKKHCCPVKYFIEGLKPNVYRILLTSGLSLRLVIVTTLKDFSPNTFIGQQ